MFDDPKKELERLHARLLAAEEAGWDEDDGTPEDELEELRKALDRGKKKKEKKKTASRSRSDTSEAPTGFLPTIEIVEETEEDAPEDPEAAEWKRKQKGALLVIVLLLEAAALLVVIAWWMLWK